MNSLLDDLAKLKELVATPDGTRTLNLNKIRGICDYVIGENTSRLADTKLQELRELFKTWEHYRGSTAFPIPGGVDAFIIHKPDSFNSEYEYCRLRLQLLDHCIESLKNA